MSGLVALKSTSGPSSPTRTVRQDTYHESPSSPTRRPRLMKPVENEYLQQQKSAHGTFLEDSTPIDYPGDHEDGEDPHDLAFSSARAPRASMVDHLVMSLDQFSSASLGGPPASPKNMSDDTGLGSRARGHTFSSSVSSEGDIRNAKNRPPFSLPASRIPRRNSARYQKDLQKLPSIFGDEEDSVRVKVYDAQRAAVPPKFRSKKSNRAGAKSSTSSASSSIDLGHLASFTGRLGPAGNRRSRSFDFGSRSHQYSFDHRADVNIAPTPIVYAGPEAQGSPTKANFAVAGPTIVRKNSTKSSKSVYGRKQRAGTLGTNTVKPRQHEAPPIPSLRNNSNMSSSVFDPKSTLQGTPESAATQRPGFFRRVFGSSKNTVPSPESASTPKPIPPRLSQDRATSFQDDANHLKTPPRSQKVAPRPSMDTSANKENQPALNKKSSAFFRRRKKSNSNNIPPPLPLTLNANMKSEQELVIGSSPVSSLRAFMDPYLVGSHPPSRGHTRTNSMQGFYTPPPGAVPNTAMYRDAMQRPNSGKHGRTNSNNSARTVNQTRPGSSLRVPHQDSFLADSSSTEERASKTARDVSPAAESAHNGSRPGDENLKSTPSATNVTTSPAGPSLRPAIPLRKESWKSETAQDSPSKTSDHSSAISSTDRIEATKRQESSKPASHPGVDRKLSQTSHHASGSDISEYKSAPSTPVGTSEVPRHEAKRSLVVHVSHPSICQGVSDVDTEKARRIYDNTDEELDQSVAAAWLGEAGTERERVRAVYMNLFDWSNQNILVSLRSLCDRLVLKGETQQVDRVLDAFAKRWCECNGGHRFKSTDVVHTICYSLLLLNTDLHLADIGQKMTRTQFLRNALPTIRRVAQDSQAENTPRAPSPRSPTFPREETLSRASTENDITSALRNANRPIDKLNREDSGDVEVVSVVSGPLNENGKDWDTQIEGILRSFYSSISQQPLPLFGSQTECIPPLPQNNNLLSLGSSMLRRTPSTLSKAHSESNRARMGSETKSLGSRWLNKNRSRPRLASAAAFGSSRTSLDEQSSAWSPSMSSTWSKASLGKTLTSMSVDSFGTEATHADYQSSIGFANALSQAIIRDDHFDMPLDEGIKAAPLLADDSLELCGAPWAKEGIVKHKCHLEGVDKRSKDRNWTDCFAVIEKGWMRLFSFSMTAKSLRNKAKNQKPGAVVGGGNWQDNAEEIWKFALRHAIASALPPPGYSKARPFVFALSLPTGAVHLFSVGTPDIVKEFVATANFWSARMSKEPMMGGISNMEYGWSDSIINRALIHSESQPFLTSTASPRPSTQLSIRSSLDHAGGLRVKLPGDKIYINDWNPPQQSMFPSQLMEVDQLKALQTYVHNVEEELQKHNELRGPMLLAFTNRHPNANKAMSNWEKKSSYLLREIVKFRTYIDTLQNAQSTKDKIYKMRKEEEEARRVEDEPRTSNVSVVTA